MAGLAESANNLLADEPGSSGDEDFHPSRGRATGIDCTLHAFRKAEVAQISNLLCRRLSAFAARQSAASARRRPVGRCRNFEAFEALADWKSAIRQTGSLRYGVHDLCQMRSHHHLERGVASSSFRQ